MTREEAIMLLEKLRTFHNGTYAKSIDIAIEALQAEPKHGKWEESPTCWIACSVCGNEPPSETNIATDYCPNCGAKMDGGVK